MNRLKIFLLTTCFIFTFAISSFADSSSDSSIETYSLALDSNKYYVSFISAKTGLHWVYTFNDCYVGSDDLVRITGNLKLYKYSDGEYIPYDCTSTVYFNSSPLNNAYYTDSYDLKILFENSGFIVNDSSLAGSSPLPPLQVEELPKMVGSTILLVASVGISILCLMQFPTFVKKLLLFLR